MNVWNKRFGTGARRTVAMLCLVCLLACFGTVRVSAAGNARITVASCSAEQDTSVSVAVRLDGNPGIWGLKLRIGYDSSAMTLDAVDAGNLFSEDELTCSESLSKNPYVIVASRGKLEDLTGDGSLVTLKFSVKAGAEQKDYPVTVEIVQAVNVADENVSVDAVSGSITVVQCLHEVKQWVVSEKAACEKTGTEVLACKKCAATFESRAVPATGHRHTEVRNVVAATQTQAGYSGDTYCIDCGKLISKGVATEKLPADTQTTDSQPIETKPGETKPEDTKPEESKPAETKPADKKPQITSGNQTIFRKDSDESLVFVSDAEYEDFIRVEVDNVTIHADRYTVKSGSTIVTLRQNYLNTLDAGQHTLSIVSKTGTATASFTIEEAEAQTEESEASENETSQTQTPDNVPDNTVPESNGDSSFSSGTIILIVVIVACLICVGIAGAVVMKKRRG